MSERVYAIGDIHGQAAALDHVLDLIDADDGRDARVVFLGDYVDRGPESRGVIDRLIAGQAAGRDWICLRGNHDRMFSLFLQSPPQQDPHLMVDMYWLHARLGGETTLASYGVDASGRRRLKDVHADALAAIPEAHVNFLASLRLFYDTADLFFAHAGIRPEVALEAQSEEDLLWIRKEFHVFKEPHPKLVVHGHTPVDAVIHYGNRVNLDTGAGYGRPLSVAVFEAGACFALTAQGRTELKPV